MNEIPQAESATISSGVPMFNDCRVCDLMSFFRQKIIRDESRLEEFMLESLPELQFVVSVGKFGKLLPLKENATTLTFHLLESFFCYYHDNSFSIGNCHGSKFQYCLANLAVKRKVLEVFPNNADAKFAMDVQSWFTNKTNSLAVSRSGAHRAPTCTICFERSRNKKIVRADRPYLGQNIGEVLSGKVSRSVVKTQELP
ncbi:hypothetical protein DAPPUDRAFT_312515 [Daphnia pulex]|uniref:Uncharacterized protein n=1 Tax=Daphnia pulex TaxID=6669 RepID=E9FZA1_DAPPU|nr:hypothetical protein DAPPUDRAFT_312515 [Daphnia pulex]|eukprot:EFX87020.1 hypothetical protein DAPPUDRAFT_312515 [Daphnia pulex]